MNPADYYNQAQGYLQQGQSYLQQGQAIFGTLTTDPTQLVRRIVINSAYLPQMIVDPAAAGGPGSKSADGIGEQLLRRLKPEVIVEMQFGLPSMRLAPYGSPGVTQWPRVKAIGIGAGVVLSFIFLRGIFK